MSHLQRTARPKKGEKMAHLDDALKRMDPLTYQRALGLARMGGESLAVYVHRCLRDRVASDMAKMSERNTQSLQKEESEDGAIMVELVEPWLPP